MDLACNGSRETKPISAYLADAMDLGSRPGCRPYAACLRQASGTGCFLIGGFGTISP